MNKLSKPPLRIRKIVENYFLPYNRTIGNDDLDFVMEFLRVWLIKKKMFTFNIDKDF